MSDHRFPLNAAGTGRRPEAATHPTWCDPFRCTAGVGGAHRSKPARTSGGPMSVTLGLFQAAGTDPTSPTLVELHLGRLDDVSEETDTGVGLLTLGSADLVGRLLRALARSSRA